MANFVKQPAPHKPSHTKGRPLKGGQKRDKRYFTKISQQELDLIEQLRLVINKRRNEKFTKIDLIMYCVEAITTREDLIRVTSKVEETI